MTDKEKIERTSRTTFKEIMERISRRTDKEMMDDTSEGSEFSELTLADICDLLDRYTLPLVSSFPKALMKSLSSTV